jgi:hypothetical protein
MCAGVEGFAPPLTWRAISMKRFDYSGHEAWDRLKRRSWVELAAGSARDSAAVIIHSNRFGLTEAKAGGDWRVPAV